MATVKVLTAAGAVAAVRGTNITLYFPFSRSTRILPQPLCAPNIFTLPFTGVLSLIANPILSRYTLFSSSLAETPAIAVPEPGSLLRGAK